MVQSSKKKLGEIYKNKEQKPQTGCISSLGFHMYPTAVDFLCVLGIQIQLPMLLQQTIFQAPLWHLLFSKSNYINHTCLLGLCMHFSVIVRCLMMKQFPRMKMINLSI